MITVQSLSDLRALADDERATGLFSRQAVRLDLPALDVPDRDACQARLNAYQRDCGCAMGAVFSLAGAVAAPVGVLLAAGGLSPAAAFSAALATALAALLAGLVGKLLGLFVAKQRFRRECIRISNRLSATAHAAAG